MNALLLELIAARAAAAGNPAVAELLSRMRSGSGGIDGQSVQELLAQRGPGDPTANLIAKYLADQQASSPSRQQPVVVDMEPPREIPSSAHQPGSEVHHSPSSSDAMKELRHQVESMFAELTGLRERIDSLAWALGACSICWGNDPDCRICRGRGRPGFSMPDEKLFAQLVLPAVRTLRAHAAKQNGSSLTMQPRATEPGARLASDANQDERKTT